MPFSLKSKLFSSFQVMLISDKLGETSDELALFQIIAIAFVDKFAINKK